MRSFRSPLAALLLVACAPPPATETASGVEHASGTEQAHAEQAPSTSQTTTTPAGAAHAVAQTAHAPTPTPPPRRIDMPAIDALVEAAIAEQKLPGAVVTVGRRDGIVFQRAYGHRSLLPTKSRMDADAIFDLASLTKPLVTASAVMLLCERGSIGLADPIARHLPELAGTRAGEATILQLLLHTAGLPRVTPLRDYEKPHAEALAALLSTRLERAPGTQHVYSDVGYLWLGVLVERVAAEPLDRFASRYLFEPLGLRETRFDPPAAWKPRIAPTEQTDKRPTPLIHGVVHDPRAYRLGGVAGNAGLFSSAADLARVARALLGRGELDGARILSESSVDTLTRPHFVGNATRTPGFDVHSDYDRHRGTRLSPRAYGHGGYTGVSLWIDPELDLFVIFLSNRVHPDGTGNVLQLAGDVADAAVEALQPAAACPASDTEVLPGIDALRARDFAPLAGKRVGLVTHLAAVARDGTPTLELFARAEGLELSAVFSPEHGLEGRHEGSVADARHGERGPPVYSLFGKARRPSAEMLERVDVLVVDLVDVGTRFYTYASTVHQVMLAAAEHHLPVLILDRPNPLGGIAVEGPLQDPDRTTTFVNYHRLPVRHGMTLGELASLVAAEEDIGVQLGVIEARGWQRGALHAETGLPFRAPSPNLRDPEALLLYPAVGLLESTNLSVGRGTDSPFALLGAPWLEHAQLLASLEREPLPGLSLSLAEFTPTARPHRDTPCRGLRLHVTDPHAVRPVDAGLSLARAIARLRPPQWTSKDLLRLLAHRRVHRALLRGAPLAALQRLYADDLQAFVRRRAHFLRYPTCGPTK